MSSTENRLHSGSTWSTAVRSGMPVRRMPITFPRVSIWLLLMLALGAIIVLCDGLTRVINLDLETSIEPLTYEPYPAAFVFAGIMLPLTLLYAAREKALPHEGLLLWFLFCTAVYSKDFSYLHIPGVPLYVTDAVLAILLVRVFFWSRLQRVRLGSRTMLLLLGLLATGGLAAVRGLASGQSPVFVFRDFALVGYSLYLLIGFHLVQTWAAVKRFFVVFTVGAALATLHGWAWFIAAPGQRRYIQYGSIVAVAFVGLLLANVNRLLRPTTGWALAAFLGIGVLLYNSRAIYGAVGCTLGLVLLFGTSAQKRHILARLRVLITFLIVAVLVMIVVSQTRTGAEFVGRSTDELISGILAPHDDPTAEFRFLAWAEALNRFAEHPLIGEGFGVPFVFATYETDVRPHNTYLTFLYKTGIVGIAPLLGLLWYFFVAGWRVMRDFCHRREAILLHMLLLGTMCTCLTAFFTYLFESPFTASVFWLLIGVGSRIMHLLQSDSVGQPVAA